MRFGIFVNGNTVEQWQYNCIKNLTDNGHELALTIVNANEDEPVSFAKRITNYPYRRMLFQVWNHYFFKPACKRQASIAELSAHSETMACTTTAKGCSEFFSDADIEKIKSHNLDFILRFGFNILRGDILDTARYGIWSFHHDDERVVRGGPPGFWEFMRRMPKNGVILQKLTSELDKGYVLKRIELKTITHSYREHLDKLYFTSCTMPLQACSDIETSGFNPELSLSQAPILHPPHNLRMISYFAKSVCRRLSFHLNDLFRQEDWNVGFCEKPVNEFIEKHQLSAADAHYLKKPHKSCYFADPFAITTDRDTYIFFEWYEYRKGKASIAIARKSEDYKQYHIVLEDEFHHAFPLVFEHDDIIYCLPESAQSGQLRLYRFDENELKLVFDSVLLDNCQAVDSVPFRHNGLWYIMTSQKPNASAMLNIYVSENLRGPYRPHSNNPVKTTPDGSRSAGNILNINGKIIRPSQECSSAYGTAVILNKVNRIDETAFEETTETRLTSPSKSYNKGFHTLNGNENITVFDVKRYCFTLYGFRQQLKQKLSK